jgi:low temperature requirement protein LtrA
MLQGGALLAVLWAGWEGYSWLTNAVPAEEVIPAQLLIFSAMAAMFVASLAVPGAFGNYGVIAERHGLIVIIAPGESIVAVGVGVSALALGAGVIAALVVGIALAAALWWAYFDLSMLSAERRLKEARAEERARLALDSYSYLHLPMVAGIIFSAWASSRPWPTPGTL